VRRTITVCVVLALATTACGGDDGDSSPTVATPATVAAPTTIVVPDGSDRCEDAPDPADHEGSVPTVRRPCELPTELVSTLIREGTGRVAVPSDGVIYHATLIDAEDGSLIATTWTDGQPAEVPVLGSDNSTTDTTAPGSTTPDSTTGGGSDGRLDGELIGVQAGERLRLDIPADIAADWVLLPVDGSALPHDTALTYMIDVLAVVPQLSPDERPSGIAIEPSVDATEVTVDDLVIGDGKVVEEGDTAIVAMLLLRGDNEVVLFDSWHQGQPLVMPLRPELMAGPEPATLPGVFEGLQGARVGGVRVISMPPEQAFGEGGRPLLGLPPNTDVIVLAEILGAY